MFFFMLSAESCFLVKEKNKMIIQEGNNKKRHAPACTFNFALSLMGFNEGILKNEKDPEWQFQQGYDDYKETWKCAHHPTKWIENSCVWYSKVLKSKLGMARFKSYIQKFNYGNQDVSGDKGDNDAVWLSSSLQISPQEQLGFLEKLLAHKLSVSHHAYEMTKNIMFVEDLYDGWKLYGKTGACCVQNPDGSKIQEMKLGWFIGWIQKGERKVVFVHYREEKREDFMIGREVRDLAKEKLIKLIKDSLS